MLSNFITPPDTIPTIVLIDASTDQIQEVAKLCQGSKYCYNVYLYNHAMNNLNWLTDAVRKADAVLQEESSEVPALFSIKFGPNSALVSPVDYFK
jgi:hypothetical protein